MQSALSTKHYVLKDLIAESKDGEWGQEEQAGDVVRMTVIRGTDFDAVRSGDLSAVPVRFIATRNADRKALQPLDIVMEMAGGAKNRPTGRALLLNERVFQASDSPVTCASFCRFIRIDSSLANPEYVFRLLQYLYASQQIHQFNTQHTGLSRFQYTKFASTHHFRIHDRPQQDRIAAILRDYDDLIENNRQRIAMLEEAAQQLYKEWFVRLRFPGHECTETTDGVPEGWTTLPLKEVAVINAESLRSSFDGEIEYVDISSVSTGSINETTVYDYREAPGRAKRIVKHGDIIWSCVRPNRRSHAIVWQPAHNLIVSTGFAVITPQSLPTSYVYQAVTSDLFVAYLENHAKGAAYPAVVAKDFQNAQILVPAESVVEAFNKVTKPMIDQTHTLTTQNKRLAEARDLLLPRLMSGEIEI